MNFDQLMNLCGISGVSFFLFSYYVVVSGWVDAKSKLVRSVRLLGFILLLTPLFFSWFLSEPLILTIATFMFIGGIIEWIRKKFFY